MSRTFSENQVTVLFELAGFHVVSVRRITNQYWSDSNTDLARESPWFIVSTAAHVFLMGWRKRVIHIEIINPLLGFNFADVTEDNVTKDIDYIHAWSPEKAIEYLRSARLLIQTGRTK